MKVLILANDADGLYKFRKDLIKRILDDNDVTIALPYGELVEPLKELGCKFVDTPFKRRGINPIDDLALLQTYRKLIRTEHPDLVVTYTIKPNIYGGIVCSTSGVPYAVNITGLGTAFESNTILKKIVTFLYRSACKNAKVVFFENEGNQQFFIDEKIVVKANTCLLSGAGVNLDDFSFLDYPEDDDEIRFLFMGRIMREKGVEELFSAMRKLRSDGHKCHLTMLGIMEEDYQERIQQYETDGWLTYKGFQQNVIPFIESCHCFVLPSWHEGMANTNLECAASGRPIITTNICGCKEAVQDGVTGFLFNKKDVSGLYVAMKKMIELPSADRKTMGYMGRNYMQERFDKNNVVEKTVQYLEK